MLFSLTVSHSIYAENVNIVGKFEGIIWSSYDKPGVTEFYLTADQEIEAKYIFEDESQGGQATGILNDCNFSSLVLRCIWNDPYGKGDFIAKFNLDFSSFSGLWFDSIGNDQRSITDDEGYLWNGERLK